MPNDIIKERWGPEVSILNKMPENLSARYLATKKDYIINTYSGKLL